MRVLTMVTALLAANLAYAGHGHSQERGSEQVASEQDAPALVDQYRVVIQVNGIVCSFCAHGAEKSLAKLGSLDSSEFGNGVLMDIHTQRITLAMVPGKTIPVHDIYQRIKKAGYDPVTVYFRISGTLEGAGERLLLRDAESGQLFSIAGGSVEKLGESDRVDVQVHIDATKIPSLRQGQPIEVLVDKRFSESVGSDG